jgi:hypothetical protein
MPNSSDESLKNKVQANQKESNYKIGEPIRYRMWLPETTVKPTKDLKVAVIVTHGMGQQLHFQTLDQVEKGLCQVEEQHCKAVEKPEEQALRKQPSPSIARVIKVGDKQLRRLEMTLTDPADPGDSKAEVHLFEPYWAPITEGRVTLWDVISFLWRAGRNGIANSVRNSRRWMFDNEVELGKKRWTWLAFISALGVLVTLVLLNAAVVALAGARVVMGHATPALLSHEPVIDLTQTVAAWLLFLVIFAMLAWTTRWMGFFYAAVGITLLTGLVILYGLYSHLYKGVMVWPVRFSPYLPLSDASVKGLLLVFWAVLLGISAWVWQLLIQYAGDVAAYVSPHYLNRFNVIRDTIRERVGRTVEAVYKALNENNGFEYERFVVVGHSLGSVVAYEGNFSLSPGNLTEIKS